MRVLAPSMVAPASTALANNTAPRAKAVMLQWRAADALAAEGGEGSPQPSLQVANQQAEQRQAWDSVDLSCLSLTLYECVAR